MAGVGYFVELRGMDVVQARLYRLMQLDDAGMPHVLDAVGAMVESQTRRRIEEEKRSPDGKAWAKWSEAYAATRHGGHSLLMSEGDLDDSITHLVHGDQVEVGSNKIYAAIHQFSGAEVGIPIPERPYLGLSGENRDDLEVTLDDLILRLTEG